MFTFHLKNSFWLTAVLTLASISVALAQKNPNIVENAGFESGHEGWSDPFLRGDTVDDIARGGERSLALRNSDAKSEATFEQTLDVQPGQKLSFSAWVKGEEVKGPGAGIKIESFNGSEYLDGFLPVNKQGTFNWTLITGEFTVPEGATKTTLSLYLQKYLDSGTTGNAWFDDVEVRSIPFEITQLHPNYRGFVQQGDRSPLNFKLDVHPEPDWQKKSIKIKSIFADATGKVLLKGTRSVSSTRRTYSVKLVPPRSIPNGTYSWENRIIDPNGRQRLVSKEQIRIVQKMPRVYLDSQGYTVVDGKRFFPMGLYLGAPGEDDLKRISEGGFNTVLSYSWNPKKPNAEEYMDLAEKHNLKVIYSLKDLYPQLDGTRTEAFGWAESIIKRVQDKPALLAWYTNDERPPGVGWLPNLEKMHELVKQKDPHHHPTFQAQNKYASLPQSFDVTDILAMDLYPVGWGDGLKLGITSAETRRVVRTMRGVKGTWTVPQIFDWAVYRKGGRQNPPTLDEMRNQAYQALINGATGLIFYSYFDLKHREYPRDKTTEDMELFHGRWEDVTAMAKEIRKIAPVILRGKQLTLDLPTNPQTEIGKLQDGNQQLFQMNEPSFNPQIEVTAFEDGNEVVLLMANPTYQESNITFPLPDGWIPKEIRQGQIQSTFVNGKTTFTLPSVGSGAFRLVKK